MASQLNEADSESYRKLARFHKSLYDYKCRMRPEKVLELPGDVNCQFPENIPFKSISQDYIGSTALHLTQLYKQKEIFDSLLRIGADFTIKNAKGWTVLHQSVKYIYEDFKDHRSPGCFQAKMSDEFAKAVLDAHVMYKNTKNPIDNCGISHFHIACLLDHSKVVEFFINSGIPIDLAVNKDSPILAGFTPLHIAAMCGCLESAKVLLKHGADMTIKNTRGMSPLHSVVSRNMEIIDWMHTRNATVFCFSELKSDIEAKEKIINLLICESKDGDNVIDDVGFSFFHAACTLKDTSAVEKFLEKGIDVNHAVKMDSLVWPGYTGLHFAAHFNIEMVKLLISRSANVEAKDAYGITPFDTCVERFTIDDINSILSSHVAWKDIKLSDGTTKLLDLIYTMRDPDVMSTIFELEELDSSLFIPFDSPLWPGYNILHLATVFTETINIVNWSYPKDDEDGDDDDSEEYWSEGSDHNRRMAKRPRESRELDCPYMKKIGLCLYKDVDVTAKDARGSTPIHLAFRLQKSDAVKQMLKFHADAVNSVDKDNLSHLYIACYVGNADLVKKLLSNGVDVNISLSSTFYWHENEDSFVYKYRSLGFKSTGSTPLHAAVISGNEKTISLLLEHGADVNAKDENGMTPLHQIFSCHYNYDKLLLSSPQLRDSSFNDALTHLHLASFFGNEKAIKELLDNGADINATINVTSNSIFKDYNQWSPQPLAFLVEYAGCTPLHIAMGLHPREMHIPYSKRDIAKSLLQRGADMFIGNSVGRSVAYMSLARRYLANTEDVEITFLENDVNLQKRMFEDSGITMLHIACWKVDVEAVKSLLIHGVDVNAQAHRDAPVWPKWTPMHVLMLMAANCNIDSDKIDTIMQLLLDNGADLTLTSAQMDAPLHLTEPGQLSWEVVSHVSYRSYANSPYTGLILDRLKDDTRNPVNNAGISYLHIASLRNDVDHLNKFLQHEAEVNKPINFFSDRYPGCTPLHLALYPETSIETSSRVATIELLLKHGADVHAQDINGNTPLHFAVKCGSPCNILLGMVLSAGADLKATNLLGETALEILLKSKNFKNEDVKFFLQRGFHINCYSLSTDEGYIGLLSTHRIMTEIINTWDEVLEIDSFGRTAIHNIVSIKNSRVEKYTEMIGTLMSRGLNIDHQDEQGRTALHVAVKFLNLKAVSSLLKLGADVNVTDSDGKTALARCLEYYESSMSFHENRCCVYSTNFPAQMAKAIVMYVQKMQLCGLDVHELNIKTISEIPRGGKADENDMKRLNEELEKAKNFKVDSSQLSFYNFLSDTRAWESLSIVLDRKPCPVEELFRSINGGLVLYEFPEFIDILHLQYRKFQNTRIQLNS